MNAEALRQLAFRFREARALYAGLELGLFEALGRKSRTAGTLARELGCAEAGVRALLGALVALQVLQVERGRYRLAPGLDEVLLLEGRESLANLLLHDLWHWPAWAQLDQAVRTGKPVRDRSGDRYLGNPEIVARFLDNYTLAMEQSAAEWLPRLAERIADLEPHLVMDLGGGSGALLLAVLEAVPSARGLLIEHAFALTSARERSAEHACRDRLDLVELDFEREPLPDGADVIVLSRILMGLDAARADALLERCAETLPDHGSLVVHDFDPESRVGALLSLDMLLHTGGSVPEPEEVCAALERSGLSVREVKRVVPYMRTWVASRR